MMAIHSTIQFHLGTTKPVVRHSFFPADRTSKAFNVSKVILDTSEVHFFTEDGESKHLAAALRELAHKIDGGRPIAKESK